MPDDRIWAVTHEASKFDPANPEWVSCNNFIRGAKAPDLQAFELAQNGAEYRLSRAGAAPFSFNPEDPAGRDSFIAWLAQYIPANRAQPKALVRAPARGMTDSAFASISILNRASLDALAKVAGKPVEMARFRGNIWLDGLEAWAERAWIGKTIRLGTAEIEIRQHITRCMATTANPVSGDQDLWTLKLLTKNWGHTQFGLYGVVVKSGHISLHDKVAIL